MSTADAADSIDDHSGNAFNEANKLVEQKDIKCVMYRTLRRYPGHPVGSLVIVRRLGTTTELVFEDGTSATTPGYSERDMWEVFEEVHDERPKGEVAATRDAAGAGSEVVDMVESPRFPVAP